MCKEVCVTKKQMEDLFNALQRRTPTDVEIRMFDYIKSKCETYEIEMDALHDYTNISDTELDDNAEMQRIHAIVENDSELAAVVGLWCEYANAKDNFQELMLASYDNSDVTGLPSIDDVRTRLTVTFTALSRLRINPPICNGKYEAEITSKAILDKLTAIYQQYLEGNNGIVEFRWK